MAQWYLLTVDYPLRSQDQAQADDQTDNAIRANKAAMENLCPLFDNL